MIPLMVQRSSENFYSQFLSRKPSFIVSGGSGTLQNLGLLPSLSYHLRIFLKLNNN